MFTRFFACLALCSLTACAGISSGTMSPGIEQRTYNQEEFCNGGVAIGFGGFILDGLANPKEEEPKEDMGGTLVLVGVGLIALVTYMAYASNNDSGFTPDVNDSNVDASMLPAFVQAAL